ncbi:FadR/GntR family transcriptional regulator [Actinomadura syzygii]|uniref:FadR family transcriptional regulator n=1 Tax=Actinomadura syzygii TaxID=1427538 RepID=A0A5D0UIA6_9ACTN|nr:FCD domain-containing protein [Actinomadura syzygii]TYC17526.1 FadR family transcriptional regulator [Actinomadura syzygii]
MRADTPSPAGGRAELAADRVAGLVRSAEPGARLGTKNELRALCGVSVSTFNEALRLLQARGLVSVRPGPGGGLFAAEQSPMVRLGNSMLSLNADRTSVAEAIRIRDALDPLLIEDALWHASPADVADMRAILEEMGVAADAADATAFTRANWRLHARIAAVSPHVLLRALYANLLDLIEGHTLRVLPDGVRPLPPYLRERHRLHTDLVDALARHDRDAAMHLIHDHKTGEPSS